MKKGKVFIIILLTMIMSVMTLGYAALKERIDIEGEAYIDSKYRVEITKVEEGTVSGDARSVQVPSYTNDSNNMTATFNVGLTNTSDYITYTIEIINYSTVDVRVNDVEINKTNNNMKVSKLGISNGDIILAGATKTFTVKIKLTDATSTEETGTITLSPKITRLKGGVGSVVEEVYTAYNIGDIVEFAGSNWYVIEDSSSSSDYVTLLKDTPLTTEEIGSDYSYKENRTEAKPYMSYYWSATCHYSGTYGIDTYESGDTSGCSGHNDYVGSKIKEAVDGYLTNYLDASKLKEVDGYKIRLISLEEMIKNFGYTKAEGETNYNSNSILAQSWLYFVDKGYWMMSPNGESNAWGMCLNGRICSRGISRGIHSSYMVRPVINLYKAAIE